MFGAIRYNLAHLLDFNGRDARQTFWYYILFLVVLNLLAWIAVSIPMLGGAVGQAMEAAKSGMSEQEMQAQMMAGMGDWVEFATWASVVVSGATMLLALAAFVRRLHDSNNSGWWALVPVGANLASLAISLSSIEEAKAAVAMAADPAMMEQYAATQQQSAALGLIGWIAPLVVIVFGIMKSNPGPNRYGEAPVSF